MRVERPGNHVPHAEMVIATLAAQGDLEPAPIRPEWVLEGEPIARALKLAAAPDGNLNCSLWDCTKGKFRWRFRSDEIVHILEGEVHVVDEETGRGRTLRAGDMGYFPKGSVMVWTVDQYVKKLAILRTPESVAERLLRAVGL
jgi:uncharacterized cupin superfamily protein